MAVVSDEPKPSGMNLCQHLLCLNLAPTTPELTDLILNDALRWNGVGQEDLHPLDITLLKRWIIGLMSADFVVGQVLMAPLVAACWRSAWITFNLMLDHASFIDNGHFLTTAFCVALGTILVHLAALVSPKLATWLPSGSCLFYLITRGFTLWAFGSSILLWKGWWDTFKAMGTSWHIGCLTLFIGLISLWLLGGSRTNLGTSLMLHIDANSGDYFLFRKCDSESKDLTEILLFYLKTYISEVFTISCWFGVWTLENIFIRSLGLHNRHDSATFSLVLGVTSGCMAFLFQFPSLLTIQAGPKVFHWGCNCVLTFFGLVSSVSNLRGFWILLDIYIFPSDKILSVSTSFLFAFSILVILRSASSLHGGVCRDPQLGQDPFLMPGFYLTHFAIRSLKMKTNEVRTDEEEEEPLNVITCNDDTSITNTITSC